MRLSTAFLVVFILHIHWVCGDLTTELPQSTEKSVIVEKNPDIEVKHSDDSKIIEIAPSVALNNLKQEQKEQKQYQEQQSPIEVGLNAFLHLFSSHLCSIF